MYAPIAIRCRAYGIELQGCAKDYIDRLLMHFAIQAWIKDALNESAREPLHEEECLRRGKLLQDFSHQISSDKSI